MDSNKPTTWLDDYTNTLMWRRICDSYPSDLVCMTEKEDYEIQELWKHAVKRESATIPSDLFFAGKIPLLDCRIRIDETADGGNMCEARVVIFEDYPDLIKAAASKKGGVCVGAVVTYPSNGIYFFSPIYVEEGCDGILGSAPGVHSDRASIGERDIQAAYIGTEAVKEICHSAELFLCTWYGIQIALLHPNVQNVFAHPNEMLVSNGDRKKYGYRKHYVKYIKKHVINAAEIRSAAKAASTAREYHTLVWYVIGHWRKNANGTKSFVRPYWKGKLRDIKMDLDGRIREIDGGVLHGQ